MFEHNLITRDSEILGGIPVFTGTRVQVKTILDYFEKGYPLEEFLDDFPTVTFEHVQAVLALLKNRLLERADERIAG